MSFSFRVKPVQLLVALLLGINLNASADTSVENAWIRLLPPNMKMTSAYATIRSTQADRLLGASTEAAGRVEMHETSSEGGMMNMRPVESIELGENEEVVLKPKGKHLMLMNLQKPLQAGETVEIKLELEQGGLITVPFTVRQP